MDWEAPPLCFNDYTFFVYPPSLKDRKKKGFVQKVRKTNQMNVKIKGKIV